MRNAFGRSVVHVHVHVHEECHEWNSIEIKEQMMTCKFQCRVSYERQIYNCCAPTLPCVRLIEFDQGGGRAIEKLYDEFGKKTKHSWFWISLTYVSSVLGISFQIHISFLWKLRFYSTKCYAFVKHANYGRCSWFNPNSNKSSMSLAYGCYYQ